MIVPNEIIRPGPTDVMPLLTARSIKALGTHSVGMMRTQNDT